MKYEVEQKHRVDDVAGLTSRLSARGVVLEEPVQQSDQYFAHPCRDFAQSDEALRIRTVGDASFVTYKGPKIDTTTKTRHEIELPLHSNDSDGSQFATVLTALGFQPFAIVRKQRRKFHIEHQGRSVEGALDQVESVGAFAELELSADDSDVDAARRVIGDLAQELRLGVGERRSYLEMLLEKPA
jgi:adenylate cyclase, class 2